MLKENLYSIFKQTLTKDIVQLYLISYITSYETAKRVQAC